MVTSRFFKKLFSHFNIKETILAIVLLLMGVLWFLGMVSCRSTMESQLQKITEKKLAHYHYDGLSVSFNGRKATVTGTVKSEARKSDLPFLVSSIYGVEGVNVEDISVVHPDPRNLFPAKVGLVAKAVNSVDGWLYLAWQILWLIVAATFLGFLLGWVQVVGKKRHSRHSTTMMSVALHREQIAGLEEELAAEVFRSASLEQRLKEIQTENGNPWSELSAPQREHNDSQGPDASGSDDLQEMKGLGPVMERRLNELGVCRFRQIAEWTPEDCQVVVRKIKGLKSILNRYNLVEQARKRMR